MSKLASIPDFTDGDIKSIGTTLRVMKQQLETLAGQRQDGSKGAPAVYVRTTTPPTTSLGFYKTGDFWIDSSAKKLHFYNGSFWEQL
jgi:hypothetical protein